MFKNISSKKVLSTVMAVVIGISVAGTSVAAEAAPGGHNGPAVTYHHHGFPPPPPPHHHHHGCPPPPPHHYHHHDRGPSDGDVVAAGIIGLIIGAAIANS